MSTDTEAPSETEMKQNTKREFLSPITTKNGIHKIYGNETMITPTTAFNLKALENTYVDLKKRTPFYKRPRLRLFVFTVVWLLAGMLYFHFSEVEWSVPVNGEDDDSFTRAGNKLNFVYSVFFCLQLLLGIGFGPKPILQAGNETVIVIYIVLGSSLLTSFVIYLIDRIATKISVVEKSVKDGFDSSSWEMGAIKSKVAQKSGKNFSRTLRATYIFVGLIVYILLGALVLLAFIPEGMEKNYGKQIFFLITSLSTVGLEEPIVSTGSLTFLSVYIAIGVPFYALVLSEYAALLSFNNLRDKIMKEETERRKKNEQEFWERISDVQRGAEGHLEYAEFLELELLRIGNLNLSALHAIRNRYENEVDTKKGNYDDWNNDHNDCDEIEYRKSIRSSLSGRKDENNSGDHIDSGRQSVRRSLSSPSKKILSTSKYLNNRQRVNTLTLENSPMRESERDASSSSNHDGNSFYLDMNKG